MWSVRGSQAVDQPICSFGPESRSAGPSAALGLSCAGLAGLLLGTESCGRLVYYLGPVRGAASLCSRCAPTRGFRCGRPAGVSGVGGQLGFQVWAPSLLIWVHTTGLQVCAGAGYPEFTVQGLTGEGHQRPRLLRKVL